MIELRAFTLLTDVPKVPTSQGGLYSFSVRFPSDYELGLSSARTLAVESVTDLIATTLDRYREVHDTSRLLGFLQGFRAGEHLRVGYRIYARNSTSTSPGQLFRSFVSSEPKVDLDVLRRIIAVLRTLCSGLPPLYIGMASRQSLRARLDQHLSGSTQFSQRVSKSEIEWTELIYSCIAIELPFEGHLRNLEKIVQALLKPPLSNL